MLKFALWGAAVCLVALAYFGPEAGPSRRLLMEENSRLRRKVNDVELRLQAVVTDTDNERRERMDNDIAHGLAIAALTKRVGCLAERQLNKRPLPLPATLQPTPIERKTVYLPAEK